MSNYIGANELPSLAEATTLHCPRCGRPHMVPKCAKSAAVGYTWTCEACEAWIGTRREVVSGVETLTLILRRQAPATWRWIDGVWEPCEPVKIAMAVAEFCVEGTLAERVAVADHVAHVPSCVCYAGECALCNAENAKP